MLATQCSLQQLQRLPRWSDGCLTVVAFDLRGCWMFWAFVFVLMIHCALGCTSEEFTCTDGQCVRWNMKNDGWCDCRDGSDEIGGLPCRNHTKTPTLTNAMTNVPTFSDSPTRSYSPTCTPLPTRTLTMTSTSTATATATTIPTRTLSMTFSHSLTPSASPTRSSTMTFTATATERNTISPTPSSSQTRSQSASASRTSSLTTALTHSLTGTPTCSISPSVSLSSTLPETVTVSRTLTQTTSASALTTLTSTVTTTFTKTAPRTCSPTRSFTSTQTLLSTPTPFMTNTFTTTLTRSPTPTVTYNITSSFTLTASISLTPTRSLTPSLTDSMTTIPSHSATPSLTTTASPSSSLSVTTTALITETSTVTLSVTKGVTSTPTLTPSASPTGSYTSTETITIPPTAIPTYTLSPSLSNTATSSLTGTTELTSTFTSTYTVPATLPPTLTVTCTQTVVPTTTRTPTASRTTTRTLTPLPVPGFCWICLWALTAVLIVPISLYIQWLVRRWRRMKQWALAHPKRKPKEVTEDLSDEDPPVGLTKPLAGSILDPVKTLPPTVAEIASLSQTPSPRPVFFTVDNISPTTFLPTSPAIQSPAIVPDKYQLLGPNGEPMSPFLPPPPSSKFLHKRWMAPVQKHLRRFLSVLREHPPPPPTLFPLFPSSSSIINSALPSVVPHRQQSAPFLSTPSTPNPFHTVFTPKPSPTVPALRFPSSPTSWTPSPEQLLSIRVDPRTPASAAGAGPVTATAFSTATTPRSPFNQSPLQSPFPDRPLSPYLPTPRSAAPISQYPSSPLWRAASVPSRQADVVPASYSSSPRTPLDVRLVARYVFSNNPINQSSAGSAAKPAAALSLNPNGCSFECQRNGLRPLVMPTPMNHPHPFLSHRPFHSITRSRSCPASAQPFPSSPLSSSFNRPRIRSSTPSNAFSSGQCCSSDPPALTLKF